MIIFGRTFDGVGGLLSAGSGGSGGSFSHSSGHGDKEMNSKKGEE